MSLPFELPNFSGKLLDTKERKPAWFRRCDEVVEKAKAEPEVLSDRLAFVARTGEETGWIHLALAAKDGRDGTGDVEGTLIFQEDCRNLGKASVRGEEGGGIWCDQEQRRIGQFSDERSARFSGRSEESHLICRVCEHYVADIRCHSGPRYESASCSLSPGPICHHPKSH